MRFIDLRGLTTRDFLDCERTRDAGGSRFGLGLSLWEVTREGARLEAECGIPRADLILALDNQGLARARAMTDAGYVPVFWQAGVVGTGSRLFPGSRIPAPQFVSARADLLDRIALGRVRTDWGDGAWPPRRVAER